MGFLVTIYTNAGGYAFIHCTLFTQVSFFYSELWVDDDGVYVCEAENQFGRISAGARITVTGLGESIYLEALHL